MIPPRLMTPVTTTLATLTRSSVALSFLLLLLLVAPAVADLPSARLNWIYPAGGKQGTAVEVTTGGVDLENATALHFSHPGITAAVKMNQPTLLRKAPFPAPGQFTVTIAADVPVGIYEVRAVGQFGVSTPRSFAVGDLAEVTEAGNNNSPEQAMEITVGTTVNGRTAADAVDYYKFPAKAGDRLTINVWAYRLDSRVDGTVVLYGPNGTELASSRDVKGFDPLIDFTVPADGEYQIGVFDFTYRGGEEYGYRLSVSAKPHIEFIFPPSGLAGSAGKYMLYGHNLPGGAPAADPLAAKAGLQQLEVDIQLPATPPDEHPALAGSVAEPQDATVDGFVYRLPSPQGTSNPAFISFATAPVAREVEPNNDAAAAQKITLPCEIVGQFSPVRDSDWFTFEAKKGDAYTVEVVSQRLGLPTDPHVLIQQVITNDKGEITYKDIVDADDFDLKLGNPGFDRASDDPLARFAPPEDGTYRLLVRDLYGGTRANPRLVYRLSLRPETPDFRLLATIRNLTDPDKNKLLTASPILRKGGAERLMVQVYPLDGFKENIEISVAGLPAGVACPSVIATPLDKQVTLVFQAAEDAADWTGPITVQGKAKIGDKEIIHKARPSYVVWDKPSQNDSTYARLAQQIVLCVTSEKSPIRVETGLSGTVETSRAGKVSIPVKVTRGEGFKGGLKLDPVGLPKEITGAALTLNEQTAEGKVDLNIDPKVAPGIYTVYLSGQTKLGYKRNAEGVAAAEEVKKQAEAALAEITAIQQKADADKVAAEKAATDAAAEAKKQTDAAAAAQKAATDAEAAAKAAADKVAPAKEAAQKTPDDKALADAAAAAEKAAADAAAAQTAAATALTEAQKVAATATEAAKVAEEAKTAAVTAATQAAEQLKQAQAEKQVIDKQAADLTAASQPKDVDVFVESLPITLNVAAAPLKLTPGAVPGAVKQGAQIEVPVNIERLFGFADVVNVAIEPPKEVKGISGALAVPADQAAGKLVIVAAKDATPGKLALNITATLKFNGQDLQVSAPIEVMVEAVTEEKK